MGAGNACVHGEYEGLYYVDRDYLDCYIANEADANGDFEQRMLGDMSMEDFQNFEYDHMMSGIYYADFIREFKILMMKKFKSFVSTGDDSGTIMENDLFEIVVEDNEWSYAVKLIQKEDDYDNHLEGLQKKHHQNYLEGIKNILLEMFPSIGCYGGAWTHGTITREDAKQA